MPAPMPIRKPTAPAYDPHHRAPADEPARAPRRTTAADHATSEAALRPNKDGQSPSLLPPHAAQRAKTGPARAALAKDIADMQDIAVSNLGSALHAPERRGVGARGAEAIIHAVDGVDAPEFERVAVGAAARLTQALALLGAAEALAARDDQPSLDRAVQITKRATDLILAALADEMALGQEAQRFYRAEGEAAITVAKVSKTVAKLATYAALFAGGGAAMTAESLLLQSAGRGLVTSMATSSAGTLVTGQDPVQAGIDAAPGGALGGVVGLPLSPYTKALTSSVAPAESLGRFLAEQAVGEGESAVGNALLDATVRRGPSKH